MSPRGQAAALPDNFTPSPRGELSGAAPLRLAARKGTRLYVGDEKAAEARLQREKEADSLEACMSTWSPDTHISKSKWREICRRQIKAGAAHSAP
jgi:hypothetical protein